jgi:membrane-associated protease RseP (regulator of RpoE activity)
VPPPLSPIGSLGAFIRLRSPVLDRRQLLDVGAAGPIAGFLIAIPVLLWGYSISVPAPGFHAVAGDYVSFGGQIVGLGDSVATRLLRHWFFDDATALLLSLPAFAGWVGVFVTGLNLLPLSQLDGGHVLYGLLGKRQAAVGLATVAALVVLAQRSPSWYLWVVIALFLGGGGWSHPAVVAPEWPVPASRRIVGWACVLLFILTFVPVPFRV